MTSCTKERLLSFVTKGVNIDDCWKWNGGKHEQGYGMIWDGKTMKKCHRVSWEIFNKREIPEGLVVAHACDNPECCNPRHIIAVTREENIYDRDFKGRGNHLGEKNGMCKLYDRQVEEIRKAYGNGTHNQRQLATEYGVSPPHVSSIINFKKRKSVQQ